MRRLLLLLIWTEAFYWSAQCLRIASRLVVYTRQRLRTYEEIHG